MNMAAASLPLLPLVTFPSRHTNAAVFASARSNFQFHDEGKHLELRLPVAHLQANTVLAKNVAVDAQETSLIVAIQTDEGTQKLLNVGRLYDTIKPAETVWCVDEDEIILSLKKADADMKWPGLFEVWENLAEGLPDLLRGTSIYIVGESTEINWAVAQKLAVGLKYVPLHTKQLMEQLLKVSVDEFAATEGDESVANLEGEFLSNLNRQMKVVVATVGGKQGAAANAKGWRNLRSGFSIWLSQAKSNGREKYGAAEAVVVFDEWNEDATTPVAEGCLRALKYLIQSDLELPNKKLMYVRLGARGDWPNIMPPGWTNPQDEQAKI